MPRRRPTLEQQRAALQLGGLASPHRFRVVADPEGFPIIPGRYGQIECYRCDGVPVPGRVHCQASSSWRSTPIVPASFEKLWAIPGVKRYQTGAAEMRAVFPPEALEQVAAAIKARHRRALSTDEARRRGFKRTPRATSGR